MYLAAYLAEFLEVWQYGVCAPCKGSPLVEGGSGRGAGSNFSLKPKRITLREEIQVKLLQQ